MTTYLRSSKHQIWAFSFRGSLQSQSKPIYCLLSHNNYLHVLSGSSPLWSSFRPPAWQLQTQHLFTFSFLNMSKPPKSSMLWLCLPNNMNYCSDVLISDAITSSEPLSLKQTTWLVSPPTPFLSFLTLWSHSTPDTFHLFHPACTQHFHLLPTFSADLNYRPIVPKVLHLLRPCFLLSHSSTWVPLIHTQVFCLEYMLQMFLQLLQALVTNHNVSLSKFLFADDAPRTLLPSPWSH